MWDTSRNLCSVESFFLISAVGLTWCAGSNFICIFVMSFLGESSVVAL